MDYKNAGVDIEAGYKSVELMKKHIKTTMRPEVLGGIGGFAGNRAGIPVKPDPTGLFLALEKLGVKPEECLYCGDSSVDMDTGKNAGITTIGVEWGFRTREELEEHDACYVIQKPSQLPQLVKKLMA